MKIKGKNSIDVADALNMISSVYERIKDYAKAQEYRKRS